MTPEAFIAAWKDNPLTERAGAQQHFSDLCELLGVDKPRDPEHYCFERGAKKAGGGDGWADVWKRGHFGWENKKPGRDLDKAYKQLTDYAAYLEHPPLLIVSDRERIVIHTAFTGYPDQPREIKIEDLIQPETRQLLRWVFTDPEKLRPEQSSAAITAAAARDFSAIAAAMRGRGIDHQRVAHFLVQCLFAMFAEDELLLPSDLFATLLERARHDPARARERIAGLFDLMRRKDGSYGDHDIAWFNGGLFQTIEVPELTGADLAALRAAATRDWRAIDPTIFGTLFERGLDPDQRVPLGAHYTDIQTIQKLIDPLITAPLAAEWEQTRARMAKRKASGAMKLYQGFLLRLSEFRVLDPACGSGNFLYLSLAALRDLEKRARVESMELGLPEQLTLATGPHNVLGIETNEFAAELARVTVWIGDIQWCRRNGYPHATNPILQPLDGIEHRDAILAPDGSEPEWPQADVIVGNPPFVGDKKMLRALGDDTVSRLRSLYHGRVPGGADLVTYWFEKARAHLQAGRAKSAGLVATNSIRGGANRKVLERILTLGIQSLDTGDPHGDHHLRHLQIHSAAGDGGLHQGTGGGHDRGAQGRSGRATTGDAGVSGLSAEERLGGVEAGSDQVDHRSADRAGGGDRGAGQAAVGLTIFNAWADEPWINEGAAVRVSLVCFGQSATTPMLDGQPVAGIYADLTAGGDIGTTVDVTSARKLPQNAGVSFQGPVLVGAFDVEGDHARVWLKVPNPHGRPNSDVLRPLTNGKDITSRSRGLWVVDFDARSEAEASLYEQPFEYVRQHVKPTRDKNPRRNRREKWWIHGETGSGWRQATQKLERYIATSQVAKHRAFVWQPVAVWPHQTVIAIARADDTTFGILHSRFHELWSLRLCTWLGKGNDPRYTPTTTFETFPFPTGLTPADTLNGTETLDSGAIVPIVAAGSRSHAHAVAIAEAAHRLNSLRETWLNPPEWIERLPEVVPGYPDRIIPKPEHAADLRKRTLTSLYNQRPAWLVNARQAIDQAVAGAYGWTDYTPTLPEADILRRLLALNLTRAGAHERE